LCAEPPLEEGGSGHGVKLIVEFDLNPCEEGHPMTERKLKAVQPRLEALVTQHRDLLKALVKEALDQILQAEMTDFLGSGGEQALGVWIRDRPPPRLARRFSARSSIAD
jgi:hypothetical protein